MKPKLLGFLMMGLLIVSGLVRAADQAPRIGDWSVRTAAGNELSVLTYLASTGGTLIALGASDSQEAGQAQQKAFLTTHQQLVQALTEQNLKTPPIVHFNIIAGPPRFVQGFIRRGIAREYDEPVQPEQIWLKFPADYNDYRIQTGLDVGDWGYWVWVDSQGRIAWSIEQQGEQTALLLLEQLEQ